RSRDERLVHRPGGRLRAQPGTSLLKESAAAVDPRFMQPWDRPPMSREKWMAEGAVIVLLWLALCAGALVAVLELADGTWQAIGLTAVAFIAAPLVEAPALFTERGYEEYRAHWTKSHWVRPG